MLLSDKFLKPNQDDRYYMQPSQIFYGLWTPYGILTPIMIGPWPDGSIGITYNMQHGVTFTKAQKQKIEFVEQRGVEVTIMHPDNGEGDA